MTFTDVVDTKSDFFAAKNKHFGGKRLKMESVHKMLNIRDERETASAIAAGNRVGEISSSPLK